MVEPYFLKRSEMLIHSKISFAELPAVGSKISFAELPAVGSRIQRLASLSSLRSVQGFKDSKIQRFKDSKIQKFKD
jgi:hypothetical protein